MCLALCCASWQFKAVLVLLSSAFLSPRAARASDCLGRNAASVGACCHAVMKGGETNQPARREGRVEFLFYAWLGCSEAQS